MATRSLEQAFAEASKLTAEEQEQFAEWILAELADREWQKRFDETGDTLDKLAQEALREHRAGKSEPLDPDRL